MKVMKMGMLKVILTTWILLLHSTVVSPQSSKIDSSLAERLSSGESVNVVVSFQNGVRSTLERASSSRQGDRTAQNNAIVDALKENTDASQATVVQTLSSRSGGEGGFKYFTQYWTSNRLFVKEADAATVETIAEDPQVVRIQIAPVSKIPENTQVDDESASTKSEDPNIVAYWNLPAIQVAEAWEELGGNQGEGVIVAAIDSGVQLDHPWLEDKYRGDYGWYDGVENSSLPYDLIGHGTGVVGVMVGSEETGVAPQAKWMACRGCEDRECSFEAIMNCIRFMSCPTLSDGSNPDCSKIPHVINFSIAGMRDGEPYDEDFLTMKTLGIIPVAASGNSGPGCGTTLSPANMPYVIAVSGYKRNNETWSKSGVGPAPDGRIKPDLVAPGYFIAAPTVGGDTPGSLFQGTSFAAPHVSGVIALLHVRDPDLTFEQAYDFITQNTDHDLSVFMYDEQLCNDSYAEYPNNFFGFGKVNAFKAVKAQTATLS